MCNFKTNAINFENISVDVEIQRTQGIKIYLLAGNELMSEVSIFVVNVSNKILCVPDEKDCRKHIYIGFFPCA